VATRDRGLPVASAARLRAGPVGAGSVPRRWPTCLSLRRDPDGQAAVVPPAVHGLREIVGQLQTRAGVEPHVVNHPVVLQVPPCQERWG